MKTIILDDNIEYIIIKELIINNNKYTLSLKQAQRHLPKKNNKRK